eukprot:SAG22_NODE_436_length_10519_cov_21.912188_2_plen_148_part_00
MRSVCPHKWILAAETAAELAGWKAALAAVELQHGSVAHTLRASFANKEAELEQVGGLLLRAKRSQSSKPKQDRGQPPSGPAFSVYRCVPLFRLCLVRPHVFASTLGAGRAPDLVAGQGGGGRDQGADGGGGGGRGRVDRAGRGRGED